MIIPRRARDNPEAGPFPQSHRLHPTAGPSPLRRRPRSACTLVLLEVTLERKLR